MEDSRLEIALEELRELFAKYIAHIINVEGTDFMPYSGNEFSDDEINQLKSIRAEAEKLL